MGEPIEEHVEERATAMTRRGVDGLLALALAAGPVAWAADQLVSYALVLPAARSGSKLALHALTVVALALCGAGLVAAVKVYRGVPAEGTDPEAEDADRWRERSRFLAIAGLVLSIFFALTVIAFAVPKFALSPKD